jgi:Cyclic nucleotide-binding domain
MVVLLAFSSDLTSLAGDLAERPVAAGDPIVGEGTGGVAFFFILEGETSVSVGGEEVATPGRGEYVGEPALLDPEGPRSATVTAKTGVVVAAMSRGSSVPSSSPTPRWRGRCCSAWRGACARRKARSGPDARPMRSARPAASA